MARGRRRAPVKPEVILPPEHSDDEDVDAFMAERHRGLAATDEDTNGVDDDGADLGVGKEAAVMDIAISDSSADERGDSDSEEEDSEGDDAAAADEDVQWGGRRRAWYGGDTHEYEIMEDDERDEALKDEEEEARRLQAKERGRLERVDFLDSDDELEDGGDDDADASDGLDDDDDARERDPHSVHHASGTGGGAAYAAAPELLILIEDLRACLAELPALRAVAADRENVTTASVRRVRIRFHLLTNYATNIAFYLTLRTDPHSAATDIKTHPVIAEIVRLKELKGKTDGYGIIEEKKLAPAPAEEIHAGEAEVLPSMAQVMEKASTDLQLSGDSSAEEPVKKKKKRGKRKRKSQVEAGDDDETFMRSVVGTAPDELGDGSGADGLDDGAAKRRKLNRIVGALEREKQGRSSRRAAPADMQLIRREPATPKALRPEFAKEGGLDLEAGDDGSGDNDGMFVDRMLAKKEKKAAKAAAKADAVVPHHYAFDDKIRDKKTERRRASSQVEHNRGLTRYRPRDRKTPRAKNREAYSKAVKKRKSVVREPVAAKPSSYGGEASGINMRARKSSLLSNV